MMDFHPDDQPFWHEAPEPRTRFLAYYLAIVAALPLVLLAWWGW